MIVGSYSRIYFNAELNGSPLSVGVAKFLAMDNLERNLGVTPLDGLAHRLHEIYSSFINAGFSPDQAMVLLLDFAGKDKKKV